MRTYNIFISHSWTYGDHYDQLCKMLSESPYFDHKDYSVPKDDPVHNASNDSELKEAIKNKIKPSSAVLIMAGKYATYSKWINKEIDIAKKELSKPIIAITPWGAKQISTTVRDNADIVVGWNSSSIVQAIKEHCL